MTNDIEIISREDATALSTAVDSNLESNIDSTENTVVGRKVSKINILRSLDPEVWPQNSARILQTPYQPQVSLTPVDNTHCWLSYRGKYYYSDSDKYPYVMLMKNKHLPLPIVKCCTKQCYDRFLSKFFSGVFGEKGITVHTPSSS